MMEVQQAFTFDDVLLVPGYSEVVPRDTELSSRLTRGIDLNIPFVSSAMDTVTEARLAICIAQAGGIGIIHKNMTAQEQARQVRAVKKFESGVIADPITVPPRASIREVIELTREHDISGVPVVDGRELVGIVTNRDLRFETRYDNPVASVMTPKDRLVTVREGARSLNPDYQEMAQIFQLGRVKTLRHVVLPQLFPFVVAAARSGLALIWKIVLVVELLGRSNGVGFQLYTFFQLFDVTSIFAYTLAFVAVVLVIELALLQPLEVKANRWRR